MNFAHLIKEIGRGEHGARALSEDDAYQLWAAMMDGGVPDLELGAILLALRVKGESLAELLGFHRALAERLHRLAAPPGELRPLVIPSYNGARHQPNLLPLLALLLRRFGVPVLIHGTLNGNGRTATAYILRELGIMPCATPAQAQAALEKDGLAFVPTATLTPGLTTLLALRERLGVRSSAHTLAKLIAPFGSRGVRLVSVSHPAYLERMREFLAAIGEHALLLRGTEGEAFANPKRRPQLEYFFDGRGTVLFEAETGPLRMLPELPSAIDAAATAAWINRVMHGEVPVPRTIANQLACCLYACAYTQDINQAKAIVAAEAARLVA
ncbi:MAG: DNA-binding protein YbiB [Pseudomonadota bacterium]